MGLRSVQYLTYTNSEDLFKFLHKCSETGTYNGQEIEGFVIRCHRQDNLDFFSSTNLNNRTCCIVNSESVPEIYYQVKPSQVFELKRIKKSPRNTLNLFKIYLIKIQL